MPAIRLRTIAMLRNASEALARKVADGLGITELPDALPLALAKPAKAEIRLAPSLSLMARPGDGSIKARVVALMVAHGVTGKSISQVRTELLAQGAMPRFVSKRIGSVTTAEGGTLEVDASFENAPGFLFDAVVLPDGEQAVASLALDGQAMEFIKDQYRHCKPMLVLGAGKDLLARAEIPPTMANGGADPGLTFESGDVATATTNFVAGIARHRHPERETDPPMV